MSDINLDFTVSNNSINFTVEPNEITITPTDIQLTFGSSGGAAPSGNIGQLQYKVSALQFGGVPNTSYDGSNLTLGNVANIKITGGTNGYVLQTDGTGNLDWVAQSGGGGGNGSPGGSNTQVQYNDSGTFGGNVGFTFNEITGVFTAPFHAGNGASLSSLTGGNVIGQVSYAAVANSVAGSNVSGAVNLATYATTANSVAGANVSGDVSGANHANIADVANSVSGSNIVGQVANALVAGTVYTNSQPNITSVGTLTSLSVAGNGSFGNVSATTFTGNLSGNATTAGTVTTNAQPNITSVGTLLNLNSGNITVGTQANIANLTITSGFGIALGNGASAVANGVALGYNADAKIANSVAIGYNAQANGRGTSVGFGAGLNIGVGGSSVDQTFIGAFAGYFGNANAYGSQTVVGSFAAGRLDGEFTVALGAYAGNGYYGNGTLAVGQATDAIAIGALAGQTNQQIGAIAIGRSAGSNSQGQYSIAIGRSAGNTQANNSITLDATNSGLSANIANSFFVKPIRDVTAESGFTVQLYYNPTTGEIGYK